MQDRMIVNLWEVLSSCLHVEFEENIAIMFWVCSVHVTTPKALRLPRIKHFNMSSTKKLQTKL